MPVRRRTEPDDGAEIVAAKIAILKARISLAPSPWDRPEDRRDWATEVRPEVVALVGSDLADTLIREAVEADAEAMARWERNSRGPFGPV